MGLSPSNKTNIKLNALIQTILSANTEELDQLAEIAGINLKEDLTGVDLQGADLQDIDLSCADLKWSNLRYSNLANANLNGADLRGADVRDINFRKVKSIKNTRFGHNPGISTETQTYLKQRGAIIDYDQLL
jgi:uncharacterized protein YjbI with pentapeptide repeats